VIVFIFKCFLKVYLFWKYQINIIFLCSWCANIINTKYKIYYLKTSCTVILNMLLVTSQLIPIKKYEFLIKTKVVRAETLLEMWICHLLAGDHLTIWHLINWIIKKANPGNQKQIWEIIESNTRSPAKLDPWASWFKSKEIDQRPHTGPQIPLIK